MEFKDCVFLTGALSRPDILQLILGETNLSPADLHDFQGDDSVPGIWRGPQSTVRGNVLQLVTKQACDRLAFYCAVYGAQPTDVTVTTLDGTELMVQAYVTSQHDALFRVSDSAKAALVHTRMAKEIMLCFDNMSADYVAARLSGIFRRATSYIATQALPADPERDLSKDVVMKNREQPYLNFFSVEENYLQFRRYDGQMSNVINRGALHVGQVVAVLPYDPVRDCVLLVEQFRAAVLMSGNRAPWVWQPIAGLIDPDEEPIAAAHRESAEEAGLVLSHLEEAGRAYTSPGSSTEFIYMYVGIADLEETQTIGGLAEEDEDICSRVLSFEKFMKAVDSNQFQDLPLLMLANWLARHRDRLRKMA
jgi:ADP-ribose diphosphatase